MENIAPQLALLRVEQEPIQLGLRTWPFHLRVKWISFSRNRRSADMSKAGIVGTVIVFLALAPTSSVHTQTFEWMLPYEQITPNV